MKVFITDPIAHEGIEILKEAGLEVEEKLGLSPEELKEIIGEAHALVIRSNTKVTADLLEYASNLKVVGRAGTGLDNVDIPACNKKGIVVMNTPGGNTNSAAEHTIAMLLALTRHIPQATASMKAGKWEKKKFQGQEVAGKTIGIIGSGRIGGIVSQLAKGLKMKVMAYDPYMNPEMADKLGIELVELDELLSRADYVSVHTPLTEETRGMLNKEMFDKMKPSAMVLNCARGGIVNEADLFDALSSGKLAGAALDVFEKEPTTIENPLFKLNNFICTPHLGASTREAQENVAVAVARQIADYLTKGEVRNAVNVPSVSAETMKVLGPVLNLADKMGAFVAHLVTGPLKRVEISYQGDLAEIDTAPVTISVLKSLLAPVLREDVNFVNAPVVAKDRGIKVVESKSDTCENFNNLMEIKVVSGEDENSLAGTIFGKTEPRLVRINNFTLEAVPEGHMLLIYNEDRPGVIGRIGTTLGESGINIARMQVGQDPGHNRNVILLTIDESAPSEVLERLKQQDGVSNVISVEL